MDDEKMKKEMKSAIETLRTCCYELECSECELFDFCDFWRDRPPYSWVFPWEKKYRNLTEEEINYIREGRAV